MDRASLARYLHGIGMAFDPEQPVQLLTGGLANRNYLIVVDGRPVVLRRPPDGVLPPGAHDMAREHRLLSALPAALPFIARGLAYCPDPAVIGAPFQLIEYRPGLVLHGDTLAAAADVPDAPERLCRMMVETLAAIHAVDMEAVGLAGFGRPEGFILRAIAGWSKRGARVAGAGSTGRLVAEIASFLARQRFHPRPASLLHCDFKLDNIILDPATLAPRAVVDWDMGTRGDPAFDLATLLSYWSEPDDPACLHELAQMPTTQPGFWRRADVVQHYAALTRQALDDLPAMLALARFKLGIIFLQLHEQWANGAVSEPRYARFAVQGAEILQLTRDNLHHGVD